MTPDKILSLLPYSRPFLFVDGLNYINEDAVQGHYTFRRDEYFYEGHFKEQPITPGVILTETMAQIGLVCLGIYLLRENIESDQALKFALVENHTHFLLPVPPETKVVVTSEKIYFRFGKLKCKVNMKNTSGEIICNGEISGMIVKKS